MPKGLVLTALSNRIEYATFKEDSSGLVLITGKREDVTSDALKCVVHHLSNLYDGSETAKEKGYIAGAIEGVGEIRFYPEKSED